MASGSVTGLLLAWKAGDDTALAQLTRTNCPSEATTSGQNWQVWIRISRAAGKAALQTGGWRRLLRW
jgi:hypothetical protein